MATKLLDCSPDQSGNGTAAREVGSLVKRDVTNPAHAVRGPKPSVRKGQTSVLSAEEMGELLAVIDATSLLGLCDRALIALMGYTFARVGAATGMKVQDFYIQKRRGWVRLHEKDGKVTELPCHHNLDQYLEEWIAASGQGPDPEAPLFRTLRYGWLTARTPLPQANLHLMIRGGRKLRGSKPRSALTASVPPGSPPTCRTATNSRSPNRWPAMSPPARPGSTTGAAMRLRSMVERIAY